MGTTDSVSNPVACLRSNCVPYGGPTSLEYKVQEANRKAMNRTFDGETTDPWSLHCVQNPKRSSQRAISGSNAAIMVHGEHTTFVDLGLSPEILGTEVGKTLSGRKIWLHSKRI